MGRIRNGMRVISSDDCGLGVVDGAENRGMLKVLSISGGYGYDCEIPKSWIAEVADCISLNKSSTFIAANRHACITPVKDRLSGDLPPVNSAAVSVRSGSRDLQSRRRCD